MKRMPFFATLVAILLGSSLTGLPAQLSIDETRARYDKTLEKIEKDYSNHIQTWPARYVGTLKRLHKKIKEKGSLEASETVEREIARYKEDRVLSEEHIVDAMDILEKYQHKFLSMRNGYDETRNSNIITLRDRYVEHLGELQKTLTREDNIEAAILVRDEITRVNESEKVTSAEFAMALESVQQLETEEEPVAEDPSENANVTPANDKSTPGVEIHAAGRLAPDYDGVHFKRKSLTRSGHSPLKSSVAVSIEEANQIRQTGHRNSGSYFSYRHRFDAKSNQRTVRLSIRSSGSEKPLRDLYVYIDYYSKPFDKTQSVGPSQFSNATAYLQSVDKRKLTVDFPPVSLSKQSRSSAYSYYYGGRYRGHSSRSGEIYYGCIVSVFDRDGELLYQGHSASQLGRYASATMPSM